MGISGASGQFPVQAARASQAIAGAHCGTADWKRLTSRLAEVKNALQSGIGGESFASSHSGGTVSNEIKRACMSRRMRSMPETVNCGLSQSTINSPPGLMARGLWRYQNTMGAGCPAARCDQRVWGG